MSTQNQTNQNSQNIQNEEGTFTFPIVSLRKIPNPYGFHDDRSANATMYVGICDVTKLPTDMPMDTNPRKQKLTTDVAKKIKNSLNSCEQNFYLLNRGLLFSAESVSYNNATGMLTVRFEKPDVHGNVDGGHTYKIICSNRGNLSEGEQFVKLEILTGVEGIFDELAGARNWSVPVQDKSLMELRKYFDIIKDGLRNEKFLDRISFVENDTGEIDIEDVVAIMTMFNIDIYNKKDKTLPVQAYSSKKRCLTDYLKQFDEHKETDQKDNPFVKMQPIMADIFKLHDEIEVRMPKFYKDGTGGRYGAIKGVSKVSNGKTAESRFYTEPLDVQSPKGFIYPILGAFRALVEEHDGVYRWKKDPFKVLDDVGADLVASTVSMSRALGNNPQSVGKEGNMWKQNYMTVAFSILE